MPSTTRGSILISTANDIGEALVEKLGGVGYSPNEWKDKINLCGIAPADSAPALSVLSDSAGTGDERGSILIATADAIGAILNKKYNVLRGFKPKEWASACRKMKALEEGSVSSASIASFSDGADAVPLTSCVCNIDANLDGKNAVNAVHAGVNLFNKNAITPNTWIVVNSTETEATSSYLTSDYIPVKANTRYFVSSKDSNRSAYYDKNKNGIAYFSFNGNQSFSALYDGYIRITIKNDVDLDTFIVNEGDTQATYEAYKGETKTADLGRAVYGGSADIIKGEGTETYTNTSLSDKNYYFSSSLQRFDCALDGVVSSGYMDDFIPPQGYTINHALIVDGANAPDHTMCIYGGKLYIKNLSCSNVSELVVDMNGKYIVYQLETPVDFTFEPVKIDSLPGVNNIWNDCGNTAVEYYQAPTPYTRKTATGGVANFSDQRTDLPLTKAIANIAPSIAGKSAVNLYQGKKNIYPAIMTQDGANRVILYDNIYLPMGNYYLSLVSNEGVANFYIKTHSSTTWSNVGGYNKIAIPITISDNDYYDISYYISTGINAESLSNVQLEVGSLQSAFEPYQAPTTYTAELGETVYGGSVDFVSGEVVKDCTKDSMSSSYLSGLSLDTYIGYEASTAYFGGHPSVWVRNWNYQTAAARTSVGIKCACDEFPASMNNTTIFSAQYRIYFDVNGKNISSVQDFIDYVENLEQNGKQLEITYEVATPTESAIPGRVISPIEGVNNYWNDAGGDTEIQYFENEA